MHICVYVGVGPGRFITGHKDKDMQGIALLTQKNVTMQLQAYLAPPLYVLTES